MSVTFSDINNYRNYPNSREYKQQLPKAERGDLGKKASEIIDPLMSEFRAIAIFTSNFTQLFRLKLK
jgi:hypothetical protein